MVNKLLNRKQFVSFLAEIFAFCDSHVDKRRFLRAIVIVFVKFFQFNLLFDCFLFDKC
jgi:hypothetical protein